VKKDRLEYETIQLKGNLENETIELQEERWPRIGDDRNVKKDRLEYETILLKGNLENETIEFKDDLEDERIELEKKRF